MNDDEKRKFAFKIESFSRFVITLDSRASELSEGDQLKNLCTVLLNCSRKSYNILTNEIAGNDHKTIKKCTRCGEEKALTDFYRQNRNQDGYGSHCKVCHRAYCKKRG